jgi:predicted  nucleic acid-binding Zn-ribbon protein
MPKILEDCVSEVMAKGHDESSAWAICRTSLGLSVDKTSREELMKHADEMSAQMKSGKLNYSAPETFDIPGVEIFAAGKWNGDNYTEKDLDDIVSSFNDLKDKIKPYLKLGHGSDQKLLRDDELPSAGWISNLKRNGKKLIADFVRIPKKIYEVLKRGAYSRISSELWWDIPIDGKTYRRVLKAVAILGGETPAVSNLNDILSLYLLEQEAEAFSTQTETRTYEVDVEASEIKEMNMPTPEELQKCHASLSEANKTIEGMRGEMDGMKKKHTEQEAELKRLSEENAELKKLSVDLKAEKRAVEVDKMLSQLITDKKIVPAQKDSLRMLLLELPESKEKKYKLGDKEYDGLEPVVMAFIEAHAEAPNTETETEKGDINSDLTDKAKKYAEEHKVSFAEALKTLTRKEQ